jgi:hypothetical protein
MFESKIEPPIWNRFIYLSLVIIVLLACRLPGKTSPATEEPSPIPPTSTVEQPSPIPPTPTFKPPDGFQEFQDIERGISIYYPDGWITTEVIAGQYAIFQSYPVDKYIGGEGFQAGDTKCDLNLRLEAATAEDLLTQWTSDSMTTILSQEEVILASGMTGLRVDLDSRGSSLLMFTEINEGLIALTCYGAREYFDEIALTINSLD